MATRIDVTIKDLYQILNRIDHRQLEDGDWAVIGAFVSKQIEHALSRQARLKAKADQQAAQEKSKQDEEEAAAAAEAEAETAHGVEQSSNAEDAATTEESSEGSPPSGVSTGAGVPAGADSTGLNPLKKGHGRNGADAFSNATKYIHSLTDGIIGAICDLCGVGRIFPYRDKVTIRVVGQPLFAAFRHEFEQGRCRLCGNIITAKGLDQVIQRGIGTSYIVYDYSVCAMLLVMHYFAGAPFKRLEALHQGWGVPMPDANQWRIADECDDLLAPLYRALEKHAIQNATTLSFDDTGSMILEIRQQIQKELQVLKGLGETTQHVRTGINASCIYMKTKAAKIFLFYTGRHHAAEMVDRLLDHRRGRSDKLVTVTDAASKNFAHSHADELEQAVCNAHCYMKFRAIKGQFPAEYQVAGEVYKNVFANDDKAEKLGLDPDKRMLYHHQHSKPQMLKLWQMCKDKIDSRLVEPNCPLWEPLSFVINQWPRLTKFYEVPGIPLDSNIVEQALIIPVRYLAGSFSYKNQIGADVGDCHMSLIATANANGVEPVAYLTECLRNHEDLAKRPDHYLPWVYRDRLQEIDNVPRGQPHPPSSSKPSAAEEVRHPMRPGTHRAPPDCGPHEVEAALGFDEPDGQPRSREHPDCPYATFLHKSGNEHLDGSPPQMRT